MKMPTAFLLALLASLGKSYVQVGGEQAAPSALNVALTNGRWFDGSTFQPRTLYSVDGHFSATSRWIP